MKKLALALLLCVSAVRAEPYLSAKNEGGRRDCFNDVPDSELRWFKGDVFNAAFWCGVSRLLGVYKRKDTRKV